MNDIIKFNSLEYWQSRHEQYLLDPSGVGNVSLSKEENVRIYAAMDEYVELLVKALNGSSSTKVLDLGCGIGMISGAFIRLGCQYTGIDISEKAIEIASQKHPTGIFRVGNIAETPFTEKFDIIIERTVFIHLVEDNYWRSVISEVKRLLANDGVFIMMDCIPKLPSEVPGKASHINFRLYSEYESIFQNTGLVFNKKLRDKLAITTDISPATHFITHSKLALSPYNGRPSTSFWKNSVTNSTEPVPSGLYKRKFQIDKTSKIATAGSCFAQHIGRQLKQNGFGIIDMEPPPQLLAFEDRPLYGFSMYSARYGNIYTTRQLLQLAMEAFSEFTPMDIIWENHKNKYFDALRPGVEPDGFDSANELLVHRKQHLGHVRELFQTMDLFVFTLGLTEAWVHKSSGTVYPMAPGTIAGAYEPNIYEFKNFRFDEVIRDFVSFMQLVHSKQTNKCKFLLTVSPVPLTATASGNHVMTATVYSKSVLRAVAGELYNQFSDVDYFPSYEIITNPWSKELYYESNLRSVKNSGVEVVMNTFFKAHLGDGYNDRPNVNTSTVAALGSVRSFQDDVICEEAILDAFGEEVL